MAHHQLPLAMAATLAAVALTLLASRAAGYPWPVCGDSSNFKPNSTYQANLELLAITLPKNASASPSLYATAVVGAIPEQTWAMALCRGDTNASSCLSCLTQAFRDLANDCTYDKDGTIYYDPCILHYSGNSGNDTGPSGDLDSSYTIKNNANVTSNKSHQFNRHLSALMDAIADYAAYNSTRLFATGVSNLDQEASITVYGMSQCTPEQTPTQCRSCLANIMAKSLDVWQDGIGGRWLSLNCTWRYETAPFFDGPVMVRLGLPTPSFAAPPPAPPAAAQAGGSKHKKKVFIIVLLASITSLCAMLLGCLMLITRLRKRAGKTMQAHFPRGSKTKEALMLWRIEESSSGFTLYDFSELAAATGGFSDGNRLGRGGYGPVYKGTLTDGTEIAVKRLAAQSGQGLEEFKNEIQLIAKLQHNNLVRLLGCCVQEEDKMLVYEYLPNRSLDFFIFDQQQGSLLDWKKRMHIIEGIAQGLLYLHKHSRVRIIHRDLKASNILLDKDLNPKISDFGMARIFASNMTVANTNRVVGTYGYMAPEYASEGIFSVRSDVFSFGVLLLEIISGKRNNGNHQYGDFINLLGYAWQLWREGRASELIDTMLGDGNDVTSILRCVKVALLCVQDNVIDRPRMTEIIEMLGHDGAVLPDPKQPPHFHLRVTDDDEVRGRGGEEGLEAQTQSFTGSFSTNDLTITSIKGR